MEDNKMLNIYEHIRGDFPEIALLYFFGSRVNGKVGMMSDYDLAIMVDGQVDNLEIQARLTHALVMNLGIDRVDVVLLKDAPIELAYHIIAEGQVIYQRDLATRVEYEAQVLGLYGDYLPTLRAQRANILQGENDEYRIQRYREALGRIKRTIGQTTTLEGKTAH
jgi:predicted nucleotidyltransferase